MAMVGRQMGILLRIKKMEEKKVPEATWQRLQASTLMVGKARRQAASFSMDMLKHYMRKCMEMDLASKTGRMDPRTALDLFIIEMGNR